MEKCWREEVNVEIRGKQRNFMLSHLASIFTKVWVRTINQAGMIKDKFFARLFLCVFNFCIFRDFPIKQKLAPGWEKQEFAEVRKFWQSEWYQLSQSQSQSQDEKILFILSKFNPPDCLSTLEYLDIDFPARKDIMHDLFIRRDISNILQNKETKMMPLIEEEPAVSKLKRKRYIWTLREWKIFSSFCFPYFLIYQKLFFVILVFAEECFWRTLRFLLFLELFLFLFWSVIKANCKEIWKKKNKIHTKFNPDALDQHPHLEKYFHQQTRNEYRYHCKRCEANQFPAYNMGDHLGRD